MKLGMPQLYEYERVEDNLILADELGLDFVELNLNFAHCRREMEEGHLEALFRKYGLEATLHFYDEGDLATYDEVADAYLSLLEKYASLGKGYVKVINIHLISGPVVTISGVKNYIYEKEFEEYSERLLKNLKRAEEICRKNGMEMVLENTDYLAKFVKKTYKLLKEQGFKLNYDVGHDRVDGDFLLNEVIPELNLEFTEMHVHDSLGKKCHLAIGEGDCDLSRYKKFMENAYVLIEVKQKSDLIISVPRFKRIVNN
ncbi:MAG: TIM barrel protein [Clostridia bacterium]|nr:TIM barrel protein [Clostridia bacterium]